MSTFTIKSIDIDILDPDSVQNAIDEIRKLNTDLKNALRMYCEELAKDGVEIAKIEIEGLGAIDSGDLHNHIYHEYQPESNAAFVYAVEEYAIFVEFGTGVVGKGSNHPALPPNYKHDHNEHGESGWLYKTDEQHAVCHAKDGTPLGWTKGMPSRPFMYNTFKKLCAKAELVGGRTIISYIP